MSGTTRVSRHQKKHSPTHIYRDHQSSLICFLHLLQSTRIPFWVSSSTMNWKNPVSESESTYQVRHNRSSAGCLEVVGPAAVWFVWVPSHSDCRDWTPRWTHRWMLSSAPAPWHCSTPISTFSTQQHRIILVLTAQHSLDCHHSIYSSTSDRSPFMSVCLDQPSKTTSGIPGVMSTADGYRHHSHHQWYSVYIDLAKTFTQWWALLTGLLANVSENFFRLKHWHKNILPLGDRVAMAGVLLVQHSNSQSVCSSHLDCEASCVYHWHKLPIGNEWITEHITRRYENETILHLKEHSCLRFHILCVFSLEVVCAIFCNKQ